VLRQIPAVLALLLPGVAGTFTLETNPKDMRVFWQREAGTQGYGGISVLRLSGAGESKTLCVWPQSAVPQYSRYPTESRSQTVVWGECYNPICRQRHP